MLCKWPIFHVLDLDLQVQHHKYINRRKAASLEKTKPRFIYTHKTSWRASSGGFLKYSQTTGESPYHTCSHVMVIFWTCELWSQSCCCVDIISPLPPFRKCTSHQHARSPFCTLLWRAAVFTHESYLRIRTREPRALNPQRKQRKCLCSHLHLFQIKSWPRINVCMCEKISRQSISSAAYAVSVM